MTTIHDIILKISPEVGAWSESRDQLLKFGFLAPIYETDDCSFVAVIFVDCPTCLTSRSSDGTSWYCTL